MIDFRTTDDGDLVISQAGDLEISTESQGTRQAIIFRLQSESDDVEFNPAGPWADLGEAVGESNTQRSGEFLKAMAVSALTKDGFLSAETLEIEVVPISTGAAALFIKVTDFFPDLNGKPLTLAVQFSFITGEISLINQRA